MEVDEWDSSDPRGCAKFKQVWTDTVWYNRRGARIHMNNTRKLSNDPDLCTILLSRSTEPGCWKWEQIPARWQLPTSPRKPLAGPPAVCSQTSSGHTGDRGLRASDLMTSSPYWGHLFWKINQAHCWGLTCVNPVGAAFGVNYISLLQKLHTPELGEPLTSLLNLTCSSLFS